MKTYRFTIPVSLVEKNNIPVDTDIELHIEVRAYQLSYAKSQLEDVLERLAAGDYNYVKQG